MQFYHFPTVEIERRIVKTYSPAAAMLLSEIEDEFKKHRLFIGDLPLCLTPGSINFRVCMTNGFFNEASKCFDPICGDFNSLGELDREVGNLIRGYGKSVNSSQYIDDTFSHFSESLKRRNPLFKKLIDEETANIQSIYMLSKKEKYKLVSFYKLAATEKDALPAFKAYDESFFDGQRDLIWSYLICQMLSVHVVEYANSVSVQDLILNFKDQGI